MSYNPLTANGNLEMAGSTSGRVVMSASAVTSTYSLIWPSAQAASSGYVLVNDGAGNLSWGPGGGGGAVSSLNSLTGALTIVAGSGITVTPSGPNITIAATGGGGGVSSVGLSLPSIFTVTNSPVTSSGTLTATLNTQSANTVFAGPTTGSAASPTFRALVAADIPSLSATYLALSGGTISGSVAVTGTISASNFSGSSSGTNTGDQTNITGNAATVTTNANLTGVVTSVGNNTSIANGAITNAMLATSYNVDLFTLSGTDITNKFVTLSSAPDIAVDTILTVIDGPMQSYGSDFTVSGSQLSWSGLFLDGVLVSGDMLVVQFN